MHRAGVGRGMRAHRRTGARDDRERRDRRRRPDDVDPLGADATCVPGSACTPPVNPLSYPLTASLTGSRTLLFEADPSSGLGAQSIAARMIVPAGFRSGLNLSLSLSTPPSPSSSGGAPSLPCSVDRIVTEGNCFPTR